MGDPGEQGGRPEGPSQPSTDGVIAYASMIHTLTSSRNRRSRKRLPQLAPDLAQISAISRFAI